MELNRLEYKAIEHFLKRDLKQITIEQIDSQAINAINDIINLIDKGEIKIVNKVDGEWQTDKCAKLAIYLYFILNKNSLQCAGEQLSSWFSYDKISSKFSHWDNQKFTDSGIRIVPGALARYGCFIDKGVVLMPSFVNVGAYIGSGSMVDTWATVGSCAYVGKNCHISGGTGLGGVLEPIGANPTIIEDNCFIGARSEICEGVIVGEGSVIGMGCYIGSSTKIIDRNTGKVYKGYIPPYSVVVAGNYINNSNFNVSQSPDSLSYGTYCVLIIKTVDEKTRSKTTINNLLRME